MNILRQRVNTQVKLGHIACEENVQNTLKLKIMPSEARQKFF